jgi:hypothetical protein
LAKTPALAATIELTAVATDAEDSKGHARLDSRPADVCLRRGLANDRRRRTASQAVPVSGLMGIQSISAGGDQVLRSFAEARGDCTAGSG